MGKERGEGPFFFLFSLFFFLQKASFLRYKIIVQETCLTETLYDYQINERVIEDFLKEYNKNRSE